MRFFRALFATMLIMPAAASSQTIDQIREFYTGYEWTEIPYSDCPKDIQSKKWRESCLAFSGSWDGRSTKDHNHRIAYEYIRDSQTLRTVFFLYNAHATDGDTVCLVASWNSASREPLHFISKRWGINAQLTGNAQRRVQVEEFILPSSLVAQMATVTFGVRECDRYDDARIWKQVANMLKPVVVAKCSALTGQPKICAAATENLADEAIN